MPQPRGSPARRAMRRWRATDIQDIAFGDAPRRKVCGVTAHYPPLTVEHIDLSDTEFWGWPMADRQAAFAMLRSEDHPPFYEEPEFIFEPGPGYYALVRHADVVEASRNPEVFSSGKGATSIPDLPVEFNEYFGSMINMDDPRHARDRKST